MKKGVFLLIASLMAAFLFPTAYGTAATEPKCYPSIAYDPQNNRYLVVHPVLDDVKGETDIYGHMLNADGTPKGTEFVISNAPGGQAIKQSISSVAYDSANQRYLVVWSDGRNRPADWEACYGQLVNADGTLYGTEFVISDAPEAQLQPAVAYDNINERFLVAWVDWRVWRQNGRLGDIYGQLVNTDGTPNGANFVVSNALGEQWLPTIAYDNVNQRFLVAWHGDPGGVFDIYGKFVNSDGTLSGTDFAISSAIDHQWDTVVAYDEVNQRFLVVWLDVRNFATTGHDIYGQLVNADGSPFGGNFAIANAADGQWVPSVAYDRINQRYLVAWYDYSSGIDSGGSSGIYDINAQMVNANGTLSGANFVISDAVNDQRCPAVAFNSNCENFLVAFLTEESGTPDIGLVLVGDECCQCPADSPLGCISGVVKNSAGQPLAKKTVVLRRKSPRPRITKTVLTDSNGCYSFSNLEEAGKYKIRVKKCKEGGKRIVVVADGGKVNDVNFQCIR